MRKLARFVNALANRCERWYCRCGCGGCGGSSCGYVPRPVSGCGNPCG